MKNTLIIAIVCIALGFAASWLIKPDAAPSDNSEASSRTTGSAQSNTSSVADKARPAKREDVSATAERQEPQIDAEMEKAMQEAQRRQGDVVRKRIADKNDLLIAAMVKELGLNADQEKALRAFYAEQLDKIEFGEGMEALTDADKMKVMAAALRGDGVNDAMQNLLSADQMEGLEAMQERQRNNQIESRAMKDLSKLQQTLDLSEDQKQKVYDVLIQDAENSLNSQSDADYVTRAMMSSMGLDIDLGDMDMGSLMGMSPGAENAPTDEASMLQKMKEDRQKKIDAKVERLAPVLNETQQQQYRKSLEGQGGFLNMFLQEAGGE